jgi:GT2 family glycosyltransferase
MFEKCICYIVLAYNNCIDTINTLRCIQNQAYKNKCILCIDNHSEERFSNDLKKYCLDNSIEYFYRKINDGYTGGNNFGWRLAKQRNYDYVCICNNDILFDDIFLTQKIVAAFCSNDNIGIISTKLITKDRKTIKTAKWQNIFFNLIIKKNQYKNDFFIANTGVIGCFMAINTQSILTDYLFDETFFMYGEEIDLIYRLIISNWYVGILNNDTTVMHLGGDFDFNKQAIWTIYLASRNHVLCARNFPAKEKLFYLLLIFVLVIRIILFKFISLKKRIVYLSGFLKGFYFLYIEKYNKNLILEDAKKIINK